MMNERPYSSSNSDTPDSPKLRVSARLSSPAHDRQDCAKCATATICAHQDMRGGVDESGSTDMLTNLRTCSVSQCFMEAA